MLMYSLINAALKSQGQLSLSVIKVMAVTLVPPSSSEPQQRRYWVGIPKAMGCVRYGVAVLKSYAVKKILTERIRRAADLCFTAWLQEPDCESNRQAFYASWELLKQIVCLIWMWITGCVILTVILWDILKGHFSHSFSICPDESCAYSHSGGQMFFFPFLLH